MQSKTIARVHLYLYIGALRQCDRDANAKRYSWKHGPQLDALVSTMASGESMGRYDNATTAGRFDNGSSWKDGPDHSAAYGGHGFVL